MNEYALLDALCADFRAVLGDKLAGFYAHGSIAFGCFRWETGDIDFLAVAKSPLTQAEKVALIRALLARTPDAPEKGIEMSVVLESVCRSFEHPAPFELHFSNAWLDRCAADAEGYCRAPHGGDPDLAAHFAVTREAGLALYGPPPKEMFAPVPREAVLDSIRADVEDGDILENPVYCALNLCRALAYREESKLLSKAGGGEWALEHLPGEHHPAIRSALNAYVRGDAPELSGMAEFQRYALKRFAAPDAAEFSQGDVSPSHALREDAPDARVFPRSGISPSRTPREDAPEFSQSDILPSPTLREDTPDAQAFPQSDISPSRALREDAPDAPKFSQSDISPSRAPRDDAPEFSRSDISPSRTLREDAPDAPEFSQRSTPDTPASSHRTAQLSRTPSNDAPDAPEFPRSSTPDAPASSHRTAQLSRTPPNDAPGAPEFSRSSTPDAPTSSHRTAQPSRASREDAPAPVQARDLPAFGDSAGDRSASSAGRTLYLSDLDGTLLGPDARTSAFTNETINALTRRGVLFSYATARSFLTASRVTAGLDVPLPVILYNGALLLDGRTGRRLRMNLFAPQEAARIRRALTGAGVWPIVYAFVDGRERFSVWPERMSPGVAAFVSTRGDDPRLRIVDSEDALFAGETFYFTCMGEAALDALYEQLRGDFHCVRQIDLYDGLPWLEIMPRTATKAHAALQLKAMLNCDRLVVFGDGLNDLELFRAADEACAVENAAAELKALATAVIPSNDRDGVARWLSRHAHP